MLTQERADKLTGYLTSDPEHAKELLAMEPEDALKEINGAGYDFTLDELNDYCKAFKLAVSEGELEEEALEDVSGGIVLTGLMVAGLIGCFAAGTAIGIAFGAKW